MELLWGKVHGLVPANLLRCVSTIGHSWSSDHLLIETNRLPSANSLLYEKLVLSDLLSISSVLFASAEQMLQFLRKRQKNGPSRKDAAPDSTKAEQVHYDNARCVLYRTS